MLLSQQHTHATRCFPKPITLSCSENPNKRQLLSQYQLAWLGVSRGGSNWSLPTREQCPQRGSSSTSAGDPGSRRGWSPRQAAQSRWQGQGSTGRELGVLLSLLPCRLTGCIIIPAEPIKLAVFIVLQITAQTWGRKGLTPHANSDWSKMPWKKKKVLLMNGAHYLILPMSSFCS